MKRMKRILAGALGFALVLGLLVVSLGLSGDPLSEKQAKRRAVAYAESLYPGQSFIAQYVTRDRPFSYRAEVQSKESEDTRFSVTTDFWVRTSDVDSSGKADHVILVEEKWNTRYRLGCEAAKLAAAVLMVELPEIRLNPIYGVEQEAVFIELCGTEEEWSEYEHLLSVDMPFDPALLERMPARLSAVALWEGEPTEEDMKHVMAQIKEALEEHGMPIAYYEIILLPENSDGKGLNSGLVRAEEI